MDSAVESTLRFREFKAAIDEDMADVEAGRVVPWDLEEFRDLARARAIVEPK
jgi:predicted transcriptional regulator